jgi:hypothetical protein
MGYVGESGKNLDWESFYFAVCIFRSTQIAKEADLFSIKKKVHLPETEEEGWGRGQGGEMTQTMYAHVNKLTKINK